MAVAMLLNTSGVCWAQDEGNEPELEQSATSIIIKGSNITVCNANGCILEIFSLTGTKIATVKIDSDEKTFDLSLKKGCYILKVNNVARKVSIR